MVEFFIKNIIFLYFPGLGLLFSTFEHLNHHVKTFIEPTNKNYSYITWRMIFFNASNIMNVFTALHKIPTKYLYWCKDCQFLFRWQAEFVTFSTDKKLIFYPRKIFCNLAMPKIKNNKRSHNKCGKFRNDKYLQF